MINTIVELLKKNKNVSAYLITEKKNTSVELFYVTDKLETNRVKNTLGYTVNVYRDFDEFRGNSSFYVNSAFTPEMIEAKIAEAVERCLFVKNKFFELAKPEAIEEKSYPLNVNDSFDVVACGVADAIFKANTYKEGWINSCEIFVEGFHTRVVNSNGVDLSSSNSRLFVELIPTWKGKDEEVEVYNQFETSFIDYEAITKRVDEIMLDAKARANAVKLPKGLDKCNVIIGGVELPMLMNFFASQLEYSAHFRHINLLNLGDDLCKGDGDKIDITLKPAVLGSTKNSSFDPEGIVLHDTKIIDNGICSKLHGSLRYGFYMGEERPTGSYSCMEVKPGSKSFEEMKKEPYIYCVAFSSPQLEGYSGYYGGEIRLGYYFDGKTVTPVTGFSISGNIHEDRNKFILSTDVDTTKGYRGPKYLLVRDMTINI